jgi:S-adenosylmethionine-dependent methyltransferase
MRRTAVAGELLRTDGAPPSVRGGYQPGAGSTVLWQTLREAVAVQVAEAGRAELDIVDVGGGTGGFAVPLASLGHTVTVVDPSPDSLAAAQRRAAEAGVPLRAVQGDVSDLASTAATNGADLVLCHSVLEYVESPEAALAAIAGILRPGGAVSVLAANAVAAVIHKVLAGRFDEARRLIAATGTRQDLSGTDQEALPRRFTLPEVAGLIEKAGLRPGPGHGVRVFTDLVPSMLTDSEPGAAAALLALEEAAASHPAFEGMATQFHVLGFRTAVGRVSGQEGTAVGRVSGQEGTAVGRVSGQEGTAVGRVSGQES